MTAREFYRKRYIELSKEGVGKKIAAVVNIDIEVQILEEYKALDLVVTNTNNICDENTEN